MDSRSPEEDRMISLITGHQAVLHRYIVSLIPNISLADDVLQETNLVLWRKADEYDHARPFLPWAMTVAWHQVQAARRDHGRDRHVFDDSLVDLLAQEQAAMLTAQPPLEPALMECLSALPADQHKLILARYERGGSVQALADQHGKSPTAISLTLMRIRKLLEKCIQQKLAMI